MKPLILLISCVMVITAQAYSLGSPHKYWENDCLTWDDFSSDNVNQGGSDLIYSLGYKPEKYKHNGTFIYRYKAYCYMDRSKSWVNPANKNIELLKYNQVIFNMVELYRRKLQNELDYIKSPLMAEEKYRTWYMICNDQIEKFKSETGNGKNIKEIIDWENYIENELNNEVSNEVPEFKKRNIGHGLFLGANTGTFTSGLSGHFTPYQSCVLGFNVNYKNSVLFFNSYMGGSRVIKPYYGMGNWNKGQHTDIAIIDLSYGYYFINNQKLKLAPFAGLGITELVSRPANEFTEVSRLLDNSLLFGINCDYNLRRAVNFIPSTINEAKILTEINLRTRLFFTKPNYSDNLKGYTVNMSLGLSFNGNLIKME